MGKREILDNTLREKYNGLQRYEEKNLFSYLCSPTFKYKPNMKIVILDGYTANPGDLNWDKLKELGECTIYERTSPDELLERAANAEAILTNKVVLNRETIAALPDLKYIGVLATGYNVVDIAAARETWHHRNQYSSLQYPVCRTNGFRTHSEHYPANRSLLSKSQPWRLVSKSRLLLSMTLHSLNYGARK